MAANVITRLWYTPTLLRRTIYLSISVFLPVFNEKCVFMAVFYVVLCYRGASRAEGKEQGLAGGDG